LLLTALSGGTAEITLPKKLKPILAAAGLWRICTAATIHSGLCSIQDIDFGQPGDLPTEKRPAYPGYPY
jgi:hypothetical protein